MCACFQTHVGEPPRQLVLVQTPGNTAAADRRTHITSMITETIHSCFTRLRLEVIASGIYLLLRRMLVGLHHLCL